MWVLHREAMPMVARPPGTLPPEGTRTGDGASTGMTCPPEDLLPSGRALAPASAPAPDRALALDALHLLREVRIAGENAGSWGEPAFAREVELIRRHLAPIGSRTALTASFGREAFHGLGGDAMDLSPRSQALRVAYALRWLELGDGTSFPPWPRVVGSVVR